MNRLNNVPKSAWFIVGLALFFSVLSDGDEGVEEQVVGVMETEGSVLSESIEEIEDVLVDIRPKTNPYVAPTATPAAYTTPTTVPTSVSPSSVPVIEPGFECGYPCNGPDLNCADFSTHAEAQSFFNCCGFTATHDPMGLDGSRIDDDGIACESLP